MSALIGLVAALASVLGIFFGWFGKMASWIAGIFKPRSGASHKIRFFVHQMRGAHWSPASNKGIDQTQLFAALEASNMTDGDCIMAARVRGRAARTSIVQIKDHQSGYSGHSYRIPARSIVEMTLHFICDGRAPTDRTKVLIYTAILTDHLGKSTR